MAKVVISLQKRLQKKLLILLGCAFVIFSLAILFFVESLNRSFSEKELALKHRVVEQTFNSYLTRAEGEMSLISQDLSLNNYGVGHELDLIFSNHEELIFGELDFFYIEWSEGDHAIDPRARLFTDSDFSSLLSNGLINRWVAIYTENGTRLLMNKKRIVSDYQNLGFSYGFISLDDNLTLTNLLLDSAGINAVRIYDQSQNRVLLDEARSGESLLNSALLSSLPLISSVDSSLLLEISQKNILTVTVAMKTLFYVAVVGVALILFYFLFIYQFNRALFTPLKRLSLHNDQTPLLFSELEPLQKKRNLEKTALVAKDHRFKLLTESVECAIIFCNEVTEIQMVNGEARTLFPESLKARTIFDFMPISCHQPIQEALKGEVGITFDITMKSMNRIYRWHAFPFVNDSIHQGVLLVGRDTTKESSLAWQLEQLNPLPSLQQEKVDVDTIVSELIYLSEQSYFTNAQQLQGWMTLLTRTLGEIGRSSVEPSVSECLGDVLSKVSNQITKDMGVNTDRVLIDCSLDDAMQIFSFSPDMKQLLRVFIMMVASNDTVKTKLSVRFVEEELEIVATYDKARPILDWFVTTLITRLKGKQQVSLNSTLSVTVPIEERELKGEGGLPSAVVAWVTNDYSNEGLISELLEKLGVTVKKYTSTDSFLTHLNSVNHFDAIIVGCDKATDTQFELTEFLQNKYDRMGLPLIWVNCSKPTYISSEVINLLGSPFEYNLYDALQQAFIREPLSTVNMQNDDEHYWVIVGGSRVTKAIWYSALENCHISAHWWDDLSSYYAVLSQYPDASIILLESQSDALLSVVNIEFPETQFFTVQSWGHAPNYVHCYDVKPPYSNEKINEFVKYVAQNKKTLGE
ncbi:hypothetical protein OFY17_04455 [Marinomonas sp. C2222]|uniref:Uncharacterized protein n=1 Tax=Marinomonas sargassi TaxID=2984494 RepID=A0ABT2YQH6_9GAMM|nr:hypothetical protein [Marinomonas sargassi]MCV2402135.1 hypothetical protein [Marinomonas sargassi]